MPRQNANPTAPCQADLSAAGNIDAAPGGDVARHTYNYRRVICRSCGWRGKWSLHTGWPACPKCHASGHKVEPIEATPEAKAFLERRGPEPPAKTSEQFSAEIRALRRRMILARCGLDEDTP